MAEGEGVIIQPREPHLACEQGTCSAAYYKAARREYLSDPVWRLEIPRRLVWTAQQALARCCWLPCVVELLVAGHVTDL